MSTVLIVEDGLTDRETLSRYLKQGGLAVTVATSGEEAMVHLNDRAPDLVVLDIILPGQSGFELCREIKSNPQTQRIPVILCSNKDTDVDKVWGNMLGADAYLSKPVDCGELLTKVRQLLGR
jgi:chemotaxis family two-component system response regulator PixH